VRQGIAEHAIEVKAYVTFEEFERGWFGTGGYDYLLDCAANVFSGVQQSAVYIEQVNRESGDHAG
jgi:hypothetical protein